MIERVFVLRPDSHMHMIAINVLENTCQLTLMLAVGHRHAGAGLLQQTTSGDTASRQPQYRHLSPRHFHLIDSHHAYHRSFNVLRLKSARRIAIIQSRTTTFGSSHPFISKW